MGYSNSSLISYTRISPNRTLNRNHPIDTITIHTMAGNLSVETCASVFANPSRKASSNYGVGSDGRIALYVEEKDRSWCTSNAANDHRSVTIEVASINSADYRPSDAACKSLITLVADICQRNNIKKLLWKGDKNLIGKVDQQNMTVHRWFAAKGCPGDWLYNNMGYIASMVNVILDDTTNPPIPSSTIPNMFSYEETCWISLKGTGLNDFAVAGIMGNLYSESGFVPINLQNSFEKKLGMTDEEYTCAVDNGTYINFVRDGAGYGLCQWTFWTRKQALLDYAKKMGKSIGDIHVQLAFMWGELQGYTKMMEILRDAKSVREASDAVLLNYEKPADQSEAVRVRRASFGQIFYDKYAEKSVLPYKVKISANKLTIRSSAAINPNNVVGYIEDRGVYTIVEEMSAGGKLWGKLKSGKGWICVDKEYTSKV